MDTIPFPSAALKCFMVINSYTTPQRKRGIMSCTSQMQTRETERLSELPKSDKETSVLARTRRKKVPRQGFFLPAWEESIMTTHFFQSAFLHPLSTQDPQTHTLTTQSLLLNLKRTSVKQAPLLRERKPSEQERS